jgi:hypothetical protein
MKVGVILSAAKDLQFVEATTAGVTRCAQVDRLLGFSAAANWFLLPSHFIDVRL